MRRREFLATSGALVVGFCFVAPRRLLAAELPGSLRRTPRLDAWIRIDADGTVTVFTGKVELGQGIETALAQIAADELDVALSRVSIVGADTARTPDEGYTAGSDSVQSSGAALRGAAAETRAILLGLAAARWGRDPAELTVEDGTIRGGDAELTYWQLVTGETLRREATGEVAAKSPERCRYVGQPIPRLDIPAKLFGEEAYVQDLRLPGMLHGRVVRPPSYTARLESVETSGASGLPGVVRVVRDGSFLAVVAEREEQAIAAAARLRRDARWSAGTALPAAARWPEVLRELPATSFVVHDAGDPATEQRGGEVIEANYFRPFLAHASIGPSCAVAHERDGTLHVWTHSQGVFPLRGALANVLGLPEERLHVAHVDGAGCYGHNGADDVACDAALLARALPGRPVRVQWMREDEFAWEPFGPAMSIRMRGTLDAGGHIATWSHELWSPSHSSRPSARRATLLAGAHLAAAKPEQESEGRGGSGGADRNSIPLYDIGRVQVTAHMLREMPVRTSALRALGGFTNVFAIESFADELAHAAGRDPLAFRLDHLTDPRGRAVLEAVARRARWGEGKRAPGRGRGLAWTRYKNAATYVAIVAEVVVERGALRVERAFAAVDAGRIVNPDGLRNQIEGGMVQSTSWTLKESVQFDGPRIASLDWDGYPILTFEEAPELDVELIDRPGEPSLGAGEASQGPMAAAIANAAFDATGVRVRELPARSTGSERTEYPGSVE